MALCLLQTVTTKATAQSTSLTEEIFADIEQRAASKQAGGAGGATTYADLQRLDKAWHMLRHSQPGSNVPQFVTESSSPLPSTAEFDVAICGGTLGIFLATALQLQGLSVAVLERGKLAGRAQEWNIARSELHELMELGVLTAEEIEAAIAVEWHDVRMGFKVQLTSAGRSCTLVTGRTCARPPVTPSQLLGLTAHPLHRTAAKHLLKCRVGRTSGQRTS